MNIFVLSPLEYILRFDKEWLKRKNVCLAGMRPEFNTQC
jgi:hypothetical protein